MSRIRVPIRCRRWPAQSRVWRKTWTQGIRDMASDDHRRSHHHRGGGRAPQRKHSINSYSDSQHATATTDTEYHSEDYVSSSRHSSKHYASRSISSIDRSRKNSMRHLEQIYGEIGHNASSAYEKCCDQITKKTLKHRKQKYRLHEDRRSQPEGRYRKRSREYL